MNQGDVAADILDALLEAVVMTVDNPGQPFIVKLAAWSAQQPDPAAFRMMLLGASVSNFAATLIDVIGRDAALKVLAQQARTNLSMQLEGRVFDRDVRTDGWS